MNLYQFIFIIFSANLLYINVNCYIAKTHIFLGETLSNVLKSQYKDYTFYKNLKEIVDVSSFGKASIWADQVKRQREYMWSKAHHYIDISGEKCTDNSLNQKHVREICENNCIYTTFLNITNDMRFNKKWIKNTTEEIYFLIHYFQDFHQPMHVYGENRGGNDARILLDYFGKKIKTNYHSLWDKFVPEFYIKTNGQKWSKTVGEISLNSIYLFEEYLFNHTQQLFKIACKVTQQPKLPTEINFEEYYNEDIVEHLFNMYIEFSVTVLRYIFQERYY